VISGPCVALDRPNARSRLANGDGSPSDAIWKPADSLKPSVTTGTDCNSAVVAHSAPQSAAAPRSPSAPKHAAAAPGSACAPAPRAGSTSTAAAA